jgi:hypothetical protein
MRLGRLSLSLIAAVVLEGCRVIPIRVTIRPLEDSVVLRRNPEGASFGVTAILRNEDSRTVHVERCGAEAQRQVNGTWRTVFIPSCLSGGTSRLLAGDSLVIPVDVYGFTAPNMHPRLDPRLGAGQYRIIFGVGIEDFPSGASTSSIRRIASAPFFVRD